MKSIILSIYRNRLKNIIYIAMLTTAFTPISLLLNTLFWGSEAMLQFEALYQSVADIDQYSEYAQFFDIQRQIQSNMSSLLLAALLLVLLCIAVLPFLQYMLSLGRGYEIGVLRMLGMSKGRVWLRMLVENVLLMAFALILLLCAAFIFHKQFAFSLLGIDAETERILTEAFGGGSIFQFNWQAFLYAMYVAVAVTLISSAFSNVLISNSAPLKLIQKHK